MSTPWAFTGEALGRSRRPSRLGQSAFCCSARASRRTAGRVPAVALVLGTLLARSASGLPPQVEWPGPFPYGLASDGRRVWAVDFRDRTLYQVDLRRRSVQLVAGLPVRAPAGLCFLDGRLWVVGADGLYSVRPDGSDCRLWSRWTWSGIPTGLATDGRRLFVADRQTHQVLVLDAQTRKRLACFDSPGQWPRGLTFHDGLLWLVDSADRAVYALNPETGRVQAAFVAPEGEPRGVAFVDGLWWFSLRNGRRLVATKVERLPPSVPGNALRSNPLRVRVKFVDTLTNRSPHPLWKVVFRLAVPPETPRQHLEQLKFEPKPSEIRRDRFGQKIAVFRFPEVAPGQTVRASWTATATLWAVRYCPDPETTGRPDQVPDRVRRLFTGDAPVLKLQSPEIQRVAAELSEKADRPLELVGAIRDYVLSRVRYVRDGRWDAAPVVLRRGTGSCSEYSYVFAALARASGLPVRFVGSTAYRLETVPTGSPRRSERPGRTGRAGPAAKVGRSKGEAVCKSTDASGRSQTVRVGRYEDRVFHRWVEVYVPPYGWLPVDANRDDRPQPPFPRRYFLALSEKLLVLSKTGWGDRKNLGANYHAARSWSRGDNRPDEVKVETDRVAVWERLPDDDFWSSRDGG